MAYNFFPKSTASIEKELKAGSKFNEDRIKEVQRAFEFLSQTYSHKTPINIDKDIPSKVNVTRDLQGQFNIGDLPRRVGASNVKFKFGNGSSGNRGVNNRGNAFEKRFSKAFQQWYAGETVSDDKYVKVIEKLNKLYGPFGIASGESSPVKDMGAANTKRPLVPGAGGWIIRNGSSNSVKLDIGPILGDMALWSIKHRDWIYLSLKLGGTTSFFNVGTKKYLKTAEIKTGQIKDRNGKALLAMFGINPRDFCDIFNGTAKRGFKVKKSANTKLTKLLATGIGKGYHVLHEMPSGVKDYVCDDAYLRSAARVGAYTIHYGGMGGKGKRIDMTMESKHYNFKLNIRDTQGGDGYPTRMMCDFKKKY